MITVGTTLEAHLQSKLNELRMLKNDWKRQVDDLEKAGKLTNATEERIESVEKDIERTKQACEALGYTVNIPGEGEFTGSLADELFRDLASKS